MSTFTCQQLANHFNWGACPCNWSPMPNVGSVSSPTFPYSTYGWSEPNKAFARAECCEIACQRAQNANPLSLLQGPMGGGSVHTGSGTNSGTKKPIKLQPLGGGGKSVMRSATGRRPLGRASNSGSCDCGMNTRICNMDYYASCAECCRAVSSDKMRSATGGGKNKVATAVNWLTSLI